MTRTAKKLTATTATRVTQVELLTLQTDAAAVEAAESALKKQRASLSQREKDLIARLRAGAEQEPGALRAQVETPMGKCSPAWKELYLAHMLKAHYASADLVEEAARNEYPAQLKAPELVILPV